MFTPTASQDQLANKLQFFEDGHYSCGQGRALKDLYGSSSPPHSTLGLFKNALKECWKEGAECSVTLKEENPEIFSLCLHALYGEQLPLKSLRPLKSEDLPLDEQQVDHIEGLIFKY